MHPLQVKICGLTNPEDVRVAWEAGADLLGFILYAKSPRYVTPDILHTMVQEIKGAGRQAGKPKTVGVFVNAPLDEVQAILQATGLDYAQLHGDEGPELLAQLTGIAFKALRPSTAEAAWSALERFAHTGIADGPHLMLDAYDPHVYGGTGKTADWSTAAAIARQSPGLLLAGGLTAENVADAVATVRPWGVDVSSGVERAPGLKDHTKVRRFIENAKLGHSRGNDRQAL
jgi:phosphoribosylanthranilate isomerase